MSIVIVSVFGLLALTFLCVAVVYSKRSSHVRLVYRRGWRITILSVTEPDEYTMSRVFELLQAEMPKIPSSDTGPVVSTSA